jgi:hypothetical protein
MRLHRARFTIRWIMVRIAVLAFPFLVLPHVKSWADYGAVLVLLATYAGIEVALRPDPGPPERGDDL